MEIYIYVVISGWFLNELEFVIAIRRRVEKRSLYIVEI